MYDIIYVLFTFVLSDKSFITHNYYVNLNYFNNNLACDFILTNGSEYDSY